MPSDGDGGIVGREYGEVRGMGLQLQFGLSGEGGVDEGDTAPVSIRREVRRLLTVPWVTRGLVGVLAGTETA